MGFMKISKEKGLVIGSGLCVGLAAVVLMVWGNPKNMGFCIACFIRDIAGALSLHGADKTQYLRPEILGLVLGSFAISVLKKEFNPRGGSSPVLRFLIGAFVMIGALVFLGCPLRMVIRLSAGDLNALVALFGFIAGIGVGVLFLNNGFTLGRYQKQSKLEGTAFPMLQVILFILGVTGFSMFKSSTAGPGSMHAPFMLAFAIALVCGALAQRSRLCFVGGIRDVFIIQDFTLLLGFIGVFLASLIGNLIVGNFHLSFAGQPVAHSAHLWNFLGMFVVGLGSVMLGGCPLRQLILAGEGNTDSAITVFGMLIGAAIAHNFKLAGSPASADAAGGITQVSKVVVILMIAILVIIGVVKVFESKKGEER